MPSLQAEEEVGEAWQKDLFEPQGRFTEQPFSHKRVRLRTMSRNHLEKAVQPLQAMTFGGYNMS